MKWVFSAMLLCFCLGPTAIEAACTGASPTWTCSADYTTLNDLFTNNTPGIVQDSDTVNLTGGTVSYTSTLTITNKSISIVGATQNPTNAQCAVPGQTTHTCINATVKPWIITTKSTGNSPAGFFRVANVYFMVTATSGAGCSTYSIGTVTLQGTSTNVRFDHNTIEMGAGCGGLNVVNVLGVADHNTFLQNDQTVHSVVVTHPAWGGASRGDGSWFDSSSIGTGNVFYFENNTFSCSLSSWCYFTDDFQGGRSAYRYNTVDKGPLASHGTETGGRDRGSRHQEFYGNTFTNSGTWGGPCIGMRGGTQMVFDNTCDGTYSGIYDNQTYRHSDTWSLTGTCGSTGSGHCGTVAWGGCGKVAVTSITRIGTIASADRSGHTDQIGKYEVEVTVTTAETHGINDGGSYLQISGVSSPTAYNGVFMSRHHPNPASTFTATKFRFVMDADPGADATASGGGIFLTSPWDQNSDTSGYRCLDQAGAGKGNILISGTVPPFGTMTPQWTNEAIEPIMLWNNTMNGALSAGVCAGNGPKGNCTDIVKANREIYNQNNSFDGAATVGNSATGGIGRGARASRPSTCTTGVGWWATDGGTNWNTSNGSGADGGLDLCSATNTWTNDWYIPFNHPHPLAGGSPASKFKGASGGHRFTGGVRAN